MPRKANRSKLPTYLVPTYVCINALSRSTLRNTSIQQYIIIHQQRQWPVLHPASTSHHIPSQTDTSQNANHTSPPLPTYPKTTSIQSKLNPVPRPPSCLKPSNLTRIPSLPTRTQNQPAPPLSNPSKTRATIVTLHPRLELPVISCVPQMCVLTSA